MRGLSWDRILLLFQLPIHCHQRYKGTVPRYQSHHVVLVTVLYRCDGEDILYRGTIPLGCMVRLCCLRTQV
jgi:hypothetical protein